MGRYLLIGRLGAGGMGVVHAAYDPELDRKVALKLLLPHAEGGPGSMGRARLLREAQALARLSHPNVVAVHDVGTHGDQVWIAMEYVAGQTLGVWAHERPRTWPQILRVLIEAARGVAAAHAVGLVHRDLKPDNVMIGQDGRVRIMDFGLAHGRAPDTGEPQAVADEPSTQPRPALACGPSERTQPALDAAAALQSVAHTQPALAATVASGSAVHSQRHAAMDRVPSAAKSTGAALALRLTQAGAVQGTPAYMAPEQWHGQEAGPAADQYGWSVMAWELLYGELPFAGDTVPILAAAVVSGQRRPPPRSRRVPGWLRRIVERGLATDSSRRWPTMAALLTTLERGRFRAQMRAATVVLAGVAMLGVGVEGYRRWDHAQRVAVCEDAGAAIDRVWNDDARGQIRSAFVASGVSYAETAADKVVPWLDRQAAAWKQARTDTCLNADVHRRWHEGTLERAIWCLEDRQLELESLVAELGRANATAVQRSVSAAASLRSTATCVDETLLSRQPVPPTREREAMQEVRAALSRADSLGLTGNFKEALAAATAARSRAEHEFDWPPLLAAARVREGHFLERTGAYADSETASAEAYFESANSGAWERAAEAATNLVYTVGYRQARHLDGRGWARHARMAIMHAGDLVGLSEARRLNHLAHVHYSAGEYADARDVYERALPIWEQALGPDHPELAASLNNFANVQYSAGAYAEARALHERALEIRERTLGGDHPDVATSLGNLALVIEATGEHTEARALHERAVAIRRQALGPDHPDVAASLTNLAVVLQATGAHGEARALREHALASFEKALGPEHPNVAASLYGLAHSHQTAGNFAEALALHLRALAIRERALGPLHPDVAHSLQAVANVHHALGAHAEALPLYMRALTIAEEALGPDHPDVADFLHSLARAHLAEDRPRDALPLLERAAQRARRGAQGVGTDVRFDLARALVATDGDRARAIAEATVARDGYRAAGPDKAAELAVIERWMAEHEVRK